MPEELKPCPFCGAVPDTVYVSLGYMHCVQCPNRACDGRRGYEVKKWQNRPLEDALRAENERLKARLEAAEELVEALEWHIECDDCAVTIPIWGDKKIDDPRLNAAFDELWAMRANASVAVEAAKKALEEALK